MVSKTKKIIFPAIILSALQLLIFSGFSFSGTVEQSSHNLSAVSGGQGVKSTFQANALGGGDDEICIFCHTPHNAISNDTHGNPVPLWNRSISGLAALTFQLYTSNTMNATPAQPTGMTLLCLSCHDGITALNVLHRYGRVTPIMTGVPGEMVGSPTPFDQMGDVYNPTGITYPGSNIGGAYTANPNIRDLSDDHPVSFVYDTTLVGNDGGLNPPGSISPLKLFNGRLECATCHNPHDEGVQASGTYPYLRMANNNSEMCITCHIK